MEYFLKAYKLKYNRSSRQVPYLKYSDNLVKLHHLAIPNLLSKKNSFISIAYKIVFVLLYEHLKRNNIGKLKMETSEPFLHFHSKAFVIFASMLQSNNYD